ncbi:uncharacterized protein CLUP02_04663 [Colletotrichum lupini]|uniref:Uncharacterized protein n=1 Tax=Colletotrichum lupini TaxID=145971 RepID=A0A9Q8SKT0_9PEZI|nr:uncharacterized protein CLUP02_04663 [Colletotrichum lupini]UQC79184.1 hypothetical protein CLUP02_04663 [Colletotrichum lupini]
MLPTFGIGTDMQELLRIDIPRAHHQPRLTGLVPFVFYALCLCSSDEIRSGCYPPSDLAVGIWGNVVGTLFARPAYLSTPRIQPGFKLHGGNQFLIHTRSTISILQHEGIPSVPLGANAQADCLTTAWHCATTLLDLVKKQANLSAQPDHRRLGFSRTQATLQTRPERNFCGLAHSRIPFLDDGSTNISLLSSCLETFKSYGIDPGDSYPDFGRIKIDHHSTITQDTVRSTSSPPPNTAPSYHIRSRPTLPLVNAVAGARRIDNGIRGYRGDDEVRYPSQSVPWLRSMQQHFQPPMRNAGGGKGHVPPLNLPHRASYHLSQAASDQIQVCRRFNKIHGLSNISSALFDMASCHSPGAQTGRHRMRPSRCWRKPNAGSGIPSRPGPKQYTAWLQTTDSMHFGNIDSSSIAVTTNQPKGASLLREQRTVPLGHCGQRHQMRPRRTQTDSCYSGQEHGRENGRQKMQPKTERKKGTEELITPTHPSASHFWLRTLSRCGWTLIVQSTGNTPRHVLAHRLAGFGNLPLWVKVWTECPLSDDIRCLTDFTVSSDPAVPCSSGVPTFPPPIMPSKHVFCTGVSDLRPPPHHLVAEMDFYRGTMVTNFPRHPIYLKPSNQVNQALHTIFTVLRFILKFLAVIDARLLCSIQVQIGAPEPVLLAMLRIVLRANYSCHGICCSSHLPGGSSTCYRETRVLFNRRTKGFERRFLWSIDSMQLQSWLFGDANFTFKLPISGSLVSKFNLMAKRQTATLWSLKRSNFLSLNELISLYGQSIRRVYDARGQLSFDGTLKLKEKKAQPLPRSCNPFSLAKDFSVLSTQPLHHTQFP